MKKEKTTTIAELKAGDFFVPLTVRQTRATSVAFCSTQRVVSLERGTQHTLMAFSLTKLSLSR